jgi:hypothetical protein
MGPSRCRSPSGRTARSPSAIWTATPISTSSSAASKGDGDFRGRATYGSGYVPAGVLAVDLDGDGRDDLVVRSTDDRALRVLTSVCQ